MTQERPKIAIIDPNTLAAIGLKHLLHGMMPMVDTDIYGSMTELMANRPEHYRHFFVAMNVVLGHRAFFAEHRRQTIVLTLSLTADSQLADFHTVCVNVPEAHLLRSLLMLMQCGHAHGRNFPPMPQTDKQRLLSDREIEVMVLIVQGLINKQIAERLHISLSTVVTHRKNIMDKLAIRSVSALTVYAVIHGYVDINTI